MATTKINLNGISELDFTNGIASVSTAKDVTTVTLAAGTEIEVNGTDTTAQTPINFQSGTNITVSNPSAGNVKIDGPSALPPSGSAGGDLSGTYPNPTVAKINGGSVPASATVLGSNSSSQPVDNTSSVQLKSEKDAASGYAGLDSGIMLKLAEMKLGRNAQTGTSYTVLDGDRAKVVTLSNTSAIAVALPQAGASSSFIDGWWCWLKNINSGVVTVTPTTSTIDGANVMIMPPGSTALLFSDGSNYTLLDGGSTAGPAAGASYFLSQGTQIFSAVGNGTTPVGTGGDVNGWLIEIPQAIVIRHISAKISTGVALGTIAFGLCDVNGGKIFSSGSQTATSGNTQYSITLGSTYLLLPGTYRTCWTASSTTIVFYPQSLINIGSSVLTVLNQNNIKYFKASNGASGGDIPATLGTFSAAGLATSTAVPIIVYES